MLEKYLIYFNFLFPLVFLQMLVHLSPPSTNPAISLPPFLHLCLIPSSVVPRWLTAGQGASSLGLTPFVDRLQLPFWHARVSPYSDWSLVPFSPLCIECPLFSFEWSFGSMALIDLWPTSEVCISILCLSVFRNVTLGKILWANFFLTQFSSL